MQVRGFEAGHALQVAGLGAVTRPRTLLSRAAACSGVIESSRINKYNEGGLVRGKLYISARAVERLGSARSGKIKLIYCGRAYTASLHRVSRNKRSAKLYIPKEVLSDLLRGGAEGVVMEIEKGKVIILRPIKFCKICGEATASPDGLCMKRHFDEPGVCVRCGGRGVNHGTLCDDCVKAYAWACGLSEWLEPGPMRFFDGYEE